MSLDAWNSLFIPNQPMTSEDLEKQILDLFRQLSLDRALVVLDQLEILIDEAEAG